MEGIMNNINKHKKQVKTPLHRLLFSVFNLILFTVITSCATPVKPINKIPTASVLETKILVKSKINTTRKAKKITFNVPKKGKALLRLINSAKLYSNYIERLEGAYILLNNKEIVTPDIFNKNISQLKVPVTLNKGENTLKIRLKGKTGNRLSLRVEAPADKIQLTKKLNPFLLKVQPLHAKAKVTALGVPVEKAKVVFTIHKFKKSQRKTATTSNAGVAITTFYLADEKKGLLQATLDGHILSDLTTVSAIAKKYFSVNVSKKQLELERGEKNKISFAIRVKEIPNNYNTIKIKHTITNNNNGISIKDNFPQTGHVLNIAKTITVTPIITAKTPGNYVVNSRITLSDSRTGSIKQSFNTTFSVKVIKRGQIRDIKLNSPFASPSSIKPSIKPTSVIFGVYVSGVKRLPKFLYLDEVTRYGKVLKKSIAILNDNGLKPDKNKKDGHYTGKVKIKSKTESEKYFQIRAIQNEKVTLSRTILFPITRLTTGARPSDLNKLISSSNYEDKLFYNEVIIGAISNTVPRRIKDITNTISQRHNEKIKIVGFLPSNNAYLLEFNGDGTVKGVNKIISSLKEYSEIKYVNPNFQGKRAIPQWFLQHIKLDDYRAHFTPPLSPPVTGSNSVTVAVIDDGVNCSDPELSGKCKTLVDLPASFTSSPMCVDIYNNAANQTTPTDYEHGTKVSALIAGQGGVGDSTSLFGVNEGVAWDVKVLPLRNLGTNWQLDEAIDCARLANAQIVNISYESNPSGSMQTSVCNLICTNQLLVAASGNHACNGDVARYPASFNDGTVCPCGAAGDRILKVGGTDSNDARGNECASLNVKSQPGEIYAPGWGVPTADLTDAFRYGTSWSTALVSGCAVIRSAIRESRGESWDANAVESRFISTSDGSISPDGSNIIDCHIALSGDDSDYDGLSDSQEASLGTDPNNSDSDDDGISDGEEVNVTSTNPLHPDSNGDGYCDGGITVTGVCVTINPDLSCPQVTLTGATFDTVASSGLFGRENVRASAINSSGRISGTASFDPNIGFFWRPGLTDNIPLQTGTELLSSPGGWTMALGVNDNGEVVGFYRETTTGDEGGFLWTESSGSVDIGSLGGITTDARAINNAGQIVGSSRTETNQELAFRRENDALTMIPLMPIATADGAVAVAINEPIPPATSGIAVGTSFGPLKTQTATRWLLDGTPQSLNITNSRAADINNIGLVVGSRVDAFGHTKAFIWNPETGTVTDLPTFSGGNNSYATAINDCGIVVGSSETASGDWHAFYWSAATGTMTDLHSLDPGVPGVTSVLKYAYDINKRSEIAVRRDLTDATTIVINNVLRLNPGSIIEP